MLLALVSQIIDLVQACSLGRQDQVCGCDTRGSGTGQVAGAQAQETAAQGAGWQCPKKNKGGKACLDGAKYAVQHHQLVLHELLLLLPQVVLQRVNTNILNKIQEGVIVQGIFDEWRSDVERCTVNTPRDWLFLTKTSSSGRSESDRRGVRQTMGRAFEIQKGAAHLEGIEHASSCSVLRGAVQARHGCATCHLVF